MPVTYSEFFFQPLVSLLITFALAVIWCSFAPQPLHLIGVLVAWLIGFWAGAENISFTFQIDYGTTWAPFEALRALFIHPIVTPFALVMGVLATYSLTRPFRTKLAGMRCSTISAHQLHPAGMASSLKLYSG